MINNLRFLPLAVSATLLATHTASLADKAGYSGDGKFEDRGPNHVVVRRTLDLGPVDLKTNKKYEFKISGLPEADYIAGVALDLPHPIAIVAKPDWFGDINVKMVLIDLDTKKAVFEINQDLAKYTWTNVSPSHKPNTSFLYGRDGDRTWFSPAKGSKYKLLVEIQSEATESVPASLFITASGNKEEAIHSSPFRGIFGGK